jgi:hypothetical protein
MKNSLHITIPQPCHEDWDKMTPTDQGAFCNVCSKCVVDFTRFSDADLLAYFNNAPKNICGRFDKKQLIPPATYPPIIPSFSKRLFLGLAMAAGLSATANAQTTAINNKPSTEQEPFYHDETAVLAPQTTSDTTGVITGVVLDSATNEPLFAVSVFIEGTNIEASTDFDGKFKLVLPQEYLKKPFALKVAYVGYLPKRFTDIVYQKNQTPLYLTLVVNEALFGDCVVILPATRWQRIKGFFKRLF